LQLEARYARAKSLVFFFGGLGLTAVNTALFFFLPFHYPIAWLAGALGMAVGLRGFDRRVRLRCGPEGLFYGPWGPQPIPWSEFDGFSVFHSGQFAFLEAHPKFPDQLHARMSAASRINASVNARFGRPAFYINPTQFDVGLDELLTAISFHMPHAA